MRRVVVPSYAKINLSLQVLNKRSDGFHNLRTFFHTISLSDTITFSYQSCNSIEVQIEGADIPDNLIARAARLFLESTNLTGRLHVNLDKRIPMGAGLGGGSSNAAVTLMTLSRLTDAQADLHALASELGSDVPFFLIGGCALGEGRGTELIALDDARPEPMLLVTPGIHVSTPRAFAALNRTPDYEAAISDEDVNDFEGPVFAIHPELAGIKDRLLELGATRALMSGSGSSIFGAFRAEDECRQAAAKLAWTSHVVRLVAREEYLRALGQAWLSSSIDPASTL